MKRFLPVLSLIIFGVVWLSVRANAATYYVSPTGNDADSGLSPSAPWEYCPGMQAWTGTGTLSPGDTVYFDSSGTWTASGNYVLSVVGGVTYDGSSWGGGTRAILRATGSLSFAVVKFNADDPNFETTLRGFELDGNSQEATGVGMGWPSSPGNLVGASKNIVDCVIHDCGVVGDTGDHYGILIGALNGSTTKNVQVLNNLVYHTGRTAIGNYLSNDTTANSSQNVLIRGNEVYGTDISGNASGFGIMLKNDAVNTTVEFNYIHDSTEGIGVTTAGSGFTGPQGAVIRYNIIQGTSGSGLYVLGYGSKDIDFYGNIVTDNGAYAVRFQDLYDALSARVYNNTFYNNNQTTGTSEIIVANVTGPVSALEFVNNIVDASGNNKCYYDLTSGIATRHDHNLYYTAGPTAVEVASATYSLTSVSSWESSGYATQPQFQNATLLPDGFTGTYGLNLVPRNNGLSLTGGVGVDDGASLSNTYDGAIDISGEQGSLARPSGGGWDIGAYELETVTAVAPAAPTGLKVVP